MELSSIPHILSKYKDQLGKAYLPYLNHAERVFRIAMQLDREHVLNADRLSIACAFHDLGIWTDGTWDYLKPSEQLCKGHLKETDREQWTEEILLMIRNHHKLLPYSGRSAKTVELFRKADLVDFSAGMIPFSIRRQFYRDLTLEFPLYGFHGHLAKSFWQHFRKRPWNPFPMVKV